MPEANVLYAVTAVVVLGLVAWVAFVLTTVKEPWARELGRPALAPTPAPTGDVPVEPPSE